MLFCFDVTSLLHVLGSLSAGKHFKPAIFCMILSQKHMCSDFREFQLYITFVFSYIGLFINETFNFLIEFFNFLLYLALRFGVCLLFKHYGYQEHIILVDSCLVVIMMQVLIFIQQLFIHIGILENASKVMMSTFNIRLNLTVSDQVHTFHI